MPSKKPLQTLHTLLLAASLTFAANSSCTTPVFVGNGKPVVLEQEAAGTEQLETIAGRLYFHRATESLSREEAIYLASSVRERFNEVGIGFESVQVIEGRTHPILDGTYILIYIAEGKDFWSEFGLTDVSEHPIEIARRMPYTLLQEALNFPYDKTVAMAYIGLFTPYDRIHSETLLEECEEEFTEPTREQMYRKLVNIAVHEVAHGLGAPHLWLRDTWDQKKRKKSPYIMENDNCARLIFHPRSIEMMKMFIGEIRRNNLSPEGIVELRGKYLSNETVVDEY